MEIDRYHARGRFRAFDRYHSQGRIVEHVQKNLCVLDVECASGHISEALAAKGCTVVGIEVDPAAAERARAFCREVHVIDLDDLERLPYPNGHFDVLVFGDVLEHTADPWNALVRLRPYLKDDGYIVVSLPNVANWAVRLRLLFGKFDYDDHTGILYVGHLRFFTLKTARALVQHAGFRIVETDATPGLHVSRTYKLLFGRTFSRLPGYGYVVYRICRAFKTLLAQQFVFIARPRVRR